MYDNVVPNLAHIQYLYAMEQIIPLLIAAIIFGFQAYQNYQKEQEKARKRNPGQRPPESQTDVQPAVERPAPAIPVLEPELQQMPKRYQEYAGFVDESQLYNPSKQRAARRQQDLLKPIEVSDHDDDKATDDETFDLREAVIYATILERPYK